MGDFPADDRALTEKFKAIGYHDAYDQSANDDDDGLATNPQPLAGFKNGYRASHDVAHRIRKQLGSSLVHNDKETGETLVLVRLPSTNQLDGQLDSSSNSAYMEADVFPDVDPYLSKLELQLTQRKS
jgi:hypothetical protein